MMIRRIGHSISLQLQLCSSFAHYKYPFNINMEEHKDYLLKVEKAEQELAKNDLRNLVPRRRRRIYDKPKRDLDLTGYNAWRLLDNEDTFDKGWAHGAPVLSKLKLQPKWVIHAFGIGQLPQNHTKSAHREYVFEDNRLARFLLYEYRNTTLYAPNDPNYDYNANHDHLPRYKKKVFRVDPEEFWKS